MAIDVPNNKRGKPDHFLFLTSTKAIPLKVSDSLTAIHSFISVRATTALGMCREMNQRKIIVPDNAAAAYAVLGIIIPTPPAIRATPAKYVQKRLPGIHDGI